MLRLAEVRANALRENDAEAPVLREPCGNALACGQYVNANAYLQAKCKIHADEGPPRATTAAAGARGTTDFVTRACMRCRATAGSSLCRFKSGRLDNHGASMNRMRLLKNCEESSNSCAETVTDLKRRDRPKRFSMGTVSVLIVHSLEAMLAAATKATLNARVSSIKEAPTVKCNLSSQRES